VKVRILNLVLALVIGTGICSGVSPAASAKTSPHTGVDTGKPEVAAEIDPAQEALMVATARASQQAINAIPLSRGNGPRILPFLAQDGSFIAVEKPILAFQIMPSSDLFGNVTVVPLEKHGRMILPFVDAEGKEIAIEGRSGKSQPR